MKSTSAVATRQRSRRWNLFAATVATATMLMASVSVAPAHAEEELVTPPGQSSEAQSATNQETPLQTPGTNGGDTGETNPEASTPRGTAQQAPQTARSSSGDYMDVSKQVDGRGSMRYVPGDELTYFIQVSCGEVDCVDAVVADGLNPSLAGFDVVNVTTTHAGGSAADGYGVVRWFEGDNPVDQPEVLSANSRFELYYPTLEGLQNSVQESIRVTLRVPADFPHELSGDAIVNTAVGTADGRDAAGNPVVVQKVEASATIYVDVDQVVSVAIDKTWTPDEQIFLPGRTSDIQLRVQNNSNVRVNSIVVKDPVAAPDTDGATGLDDSNPFRYVAFSGFGETEDGTPTSTLPEGADTVQVDAYVYNGTTWNWVTGLPANTFALPSGVVPAGVGGLRYTFSSDGSNIEYGAAYAGDINIVVEQCEADRNDPSADLSVKGYTAKNIAEAQSFRTSPNGDSVASEVDRDNAQLVVKPEAIDTTVTKSFDPAEVTKGEPSKVHIGSTNSGSNVHKWTISETDFFEPGQENWTVRFHGFTPTELTFPVGATAGTITYEFEDGTDDQVFHLTSGAAIPGTTDSKTAADVKNFSFEFVSFDGTEKTNGIAADARFDVDFNVATNVNKTFTANSDGSLPNKVTKQNTATSTVVAANGQAAEKTAKPPLTVIDPFIKVKTEKKASPSGSVMPGQDVLVSFPTTVTADGKTGITVIVIEDSWKPGDPKKDSDFWNAFELTALRPTQVPDGFKVKVFLEKDGSWEDAPIFPSADVTGTGSFQLDEEDFLAAAGQTEDITGIRYVYTSIEDAGVVQTSVNLTPYLNFTARDKFVEGGDFKEGHNKVTNHVYVDGEGQPPVGPTVSDKDDDEIVGGVYVPTQEENVGIDYIAKAWDQKWVLSQTQSTRTTNLYWNVDSGHEEVTLTDPATNPASPVDTVFDAFNLRAVNPVSVSNTAFSNGWYMKWDTVSKVELFKVGADGADGEWTGVEPSDLATGDRKWHRANGSFKGYELTEGEQASTLGVRITVEENNAAREANEALLDGQDRNAPRSGTGVGSRPGQITNNTARNFPLTWQVRDTSRSGANGTEGWVTAGGEYNLKDEANRGVGWVRNTFELNAKNWSGPKRAFDDIQIIDPVPNVNITKETLQDNPMVVPDEGAILPANYPTGGYKVIAKNAAGTGSGNANSAAANATYVRVVDPNLCTDGALTDCVVSSEDEATGDPFAALTDQGPGASAALAEEMPFNWLNITDLNFGATGANVANEVDLVDKSVVWLLSYDDFTARYTSLLYSIAAANALDQTALANVIGFAVTYVSKTTDDENLGLGGGLITSDTSFVIDVKTQLRDTKRLDGETTALETDPGYVNVKNRAFTQLLRPDGIASGKQDVTDKDDSDLRLEAERIAIAPKKVITTNGEPSDTIFEPQRNEDVAVTLSADQGGSNSSPTKVLVVDQDPNFWNFFNLKELGTITAPAGADLVQVDAATADDSGTQVWNNGVAGLVAEAALPAGVSAGDVVGLRYTFTKSGAGEGTKAPIFSDSNEPNWSATIPFTVNLRDTERDSGEDILFPRDAVVNKITAQSFGRVTQSKEEPAEDNVKFLEGSRELAVGKMANNDQTRRVVAGSMVPWQIAVQNIGTGYLDLTTIVDELPKLLSYTGEGERDGEPGLTFTHLPDGVVEPEVTFSPAELGTDATVTLDWTETGGARLAPKEWIELEIWLQLQPGVEAYQKVHNVVVATTEQELDTVAPFIFEAPRGEYTAELGETGDDFGTSHDFVQIDPGTAIQVMKGVVGSLEGATNHASSRGCATFRGLDGKDYYRSPCAANSKQGGVDDWVLRIQNAGTTDDLDVFWVYDAFPTPGDKMIIGSGQDRGSMYRPVLTGLPKITLNDTEVEWGDNLGATTFQVTYGDNVCEDVWNQVKPPAHGEQAQWAPKPDQTRADVLEDPNSPCGANTWVSVDDTNAVDQDWEAVTGLRILYWDEDHSRVFPRGGRVDVSYSTRNVVKVDDNPTFAEGAANVIPVEDEYAWNQFGVAYVWGGDLYARLAPNKVGTHLLNGSLQVEKVVDADDGFGLYLPESFAAIVSCETSAAAGPNGESQQLRFTDGIGDDETELRVELTRNEDGTYGPERVSGIPFGATCQVVEEGSAGSFGEASREVENGTVTINEADTRDEQGAFTNEVVAAQVATISNAYEWSGLEVTKRVVTEADRGSFGPFEFELSCETSNGVPVQFPATEGGTETKVTFPLEDKQTWVAPLETIPSGSVCSLVETTRDGADSTVITGTNVTDNGDGSAEIKVTGTEEDPSAVVSTDVANNYPAGTLAVEKVVAGEGGADYGKGEFEFSASCIYKNEELLTDSEQSFTLKAGQEHSFGVFPAGTQCSVEEVTNGGATEATLDPEDGLITILGPEEGSETPVGQVTVTATNTFDVGQLEIFKLREGTGAEKYGAGPFEAQVSCAYQADGQSIAITNENVPSFPVDGLISLSDANDYQAVIPGLIVGAQCQIEETDAGVAHETVYTPKDGTVVIPTATDEEPASVSMSITNIFHTGDLEIIKKVNGASAEQRGAGPFEVTVACEVPTEDGDSWKVAIPGGGIYHLSEANDYRVTIEELYAGAQCSVEETDRGGADSTSMDPSDGKVTIGQDTTVRVTITNTFGNLPKTGASIMGALIGGLVLGAAGFTLSRMNRRRGSHRA